MWSRHSWKVLISRGSGAGLSGHSWGVGDRTLSRQRRGAEEAAEVSPELTPSSSSGRLDPGWQLGSTLPQEKRGGYPRPIREALGEVQVPEDRDPHRGRQRGAHGGHRRADPVGHSIRVLAPVCSPTPTTPDTERMGLLLLTFGASKIVVGIVVD